MLIFTVCNITQLSEALVLGDSLKKNNPSYQYMIGLVDKKERINNRIELPYPIVEISEIDIPNFDYMCQQYNWDELVANCKPFFANHFLKISAKLIYFDCTSLIHNSIEFVDKNLDNHTIIIVPQLLHAGVHPDEKQILNTGIFHSGFFAIRKSEVANNFLDWWGNHTKNKGFVNLCKGMNADQLWLEHVPCLYDDVLIEKHDGLNVGIWNLPERTINKNENTVNNSPLITLNFKGMKYSGDYKIALNKYSFNTKIPFYGLPKHKDNKSKKYFTSNIRKVNSLIDKIIDKF